jgi:hypothetical protein
MLQQKLRYQCYQYSIEKMIGGVNFTFSIQNR